MKKLCWLLIFVLVLGCFAGCQRAPEASHSIENADGTLSDWMKEEIADALQIEPHNLCWWNPEKLVNDNIMYLGTYDGYVMFHRQNHRESLWTGTIAGYDFAFSTDSGITAYKDGELYDLADLYKQGAIDKEAVRIAYERVTEIEKITGELLRQEKNS